MKKALVIGASSDIGLEVTRGLIKKNLDLKASNCLILKNLKPILFFHESYLLSYRHWVNFKCFPVSIILQSLGISSVLRKKISLEALFILIG